MLYDYIKRSYYSININSVVMYYKSLPTKPPIDILLTNWLHALVNTYKNNKLYTKLSSNVEHEMYQQQINLPNDSSFFIHYDIEKATLLSHKYHVFKDNARHLGSCVDYHKQTELKKHHYESSKPIILIDLPLGIQTPMSVIDGHHRLSAKIINNDDITFVNLLTPDTLSIISQSFEKAWYSFAIETYFACQLQTYNERKDFINNRSTYKNFLKHQ